jgi:hypothetical protein
LSDRAVGSADFGSRRYEGPLLSTFLRLDELLSEVSDLSPRDVGRWTLAMDARLASARRLASRIGEASLSEEIERYAVLADEALTTIAERASALARLVDYANDERREAADPSQEMAALRERLDRLLDEVARGSVPRSGLVKGEWVNAAGSTSAAIRQLAHKMPGILPPGVAEDYARRVRESIVGLRRRQPEPSRHEPVPAATVSAEVKDEPITESAVERFGGGNWRLVGKLWHRVRKAPLMYCGVIAEGSARRSRTAAYCRECVERSDADVKPRTQRIRIVPGGAPGLGRR